MDFEEGGLVVCPATGSVRLRANYDRPEFQTSNSGVFTKLTIAGGAASFRCDWDDPEDNDSHLSPATEF